jgi:cytochrome c
MARRAALSRTVLPALMWGATACGPAAQPAPTAPAAGSKPTAAPAAPASPPAAASPAAGGGDLVAQGLAATQQAGCGGCHVIPGVPGASGTVGPSLAGVASRRTIAGNVPNNGPDDLKRWIMNPQAVKPGTQMPNLGLSDDQATRIVAFLETLR